MQRQITYKGYTVRIGQRLTYEGLKITLTDAIVDSNPEIFITENPITTIERSLCNTEDKDANKIWKILKVMDSPFYWYKVYRMLADVLNARTAKHGTDQYFIYRTTDMYKEIKIASHTSVRYHLVYFNSKGAARTAIELMGENLNYVV